MHFRTILHTLFSKEIQDAIFLNCSYQATTARIQFSKFHIICSDILLLLFICCHLDILKAYLFCLFLVCFVLFEIGFTVIYPMECLFYSYFQRRRI